MTILGKSAFRPYDKNETTDDTRPLLRDTGSVEDPSDPSDPTLGILPGSKSAETTSVNMPQSGRVPSSDFVFIKIVARLTIQLIRKFWAFSSAAVLAIVLFYWLCGGIVAFAFVTFAFSGLFYNATDWFLYHPDQPPNSRVFVPSPATYGLSFENVYIRSKDSTRIHLFLIKCPLAVQDSTIKVPTILFLHGNAGNIGHRLANVHGLVKKLGCNVCLVEYRGFGHSDGSPSEEGLYLDAQAAFDFLWSRPDIDSKQIFVFGRSLGGAVAVDLCSRTEYRDRVACLLLENTFTSIPDIGRVLFNFRIVRMLPMWAYKNQFLTRSKIFKIVAPVLFISGAADNLIPPAMMNELYRSCSSEKKRLARFPDGTHNETWMCPQYYQTMAYFLEEVVFQSLSHDMVQNPPPVLVNTDNRIV